MGVGQSDKFPIGDVETGQIRRTGEFGVFPISGNCERVLLYKTILPCGKVPTNPIKEDCGYSILPTCTQIITVLPKNLSRAVEDNNRTAGIHDLRNEVQTSKGALRIQLVMGSCVSCFPGNVGVYDVFHLFVTINLSLQCCASLGENVTVHVAKEISGPVGNLPKQIDLQGFQGRG